MPLAVAPPLLDMAGHNPATSSIVALGSWCHTTTPEVAAITAPPRLAGPCLDFGQQGGPIRRMRSGSGNRGGPDIYDYSSLGNRSQWPL